jgi:hypothetical protein
VSDTIFGKKSPMIFGAGVCVPSGMSFSIKAVLVKMPSRGDWT